MFGCRKDKKDFKEYSEAYLEGLMKLPLFQYQKEPVVDISELYRRYPDGGEYGWFCLVYDLGAFAYWDVASNKWRTLGRSMEDIVSSLKLDADIPVTLAEGKSLGQYVNGDIIPAKGKTVSAVLVDIAQEYLAPRFIEFMSSFPAVMERGSVLGNGVFRYAFDRENEVNDIRLSLQAGTESHLIQAGLASTAGVDGVQADVNYTCASALSSFQLRALATDQNKGEPIEASPINVSLCYKYFHGAVPPIPVNLSDMFQVWDSKNSFAISLDTTDYAICIPAGKKLKSVRTQNNEDITVNFRLASQPHYLDVETDTNDLLKYVLGNGEVVHYSVYEFSSATPMKVEAAVVVE